MIDYKTNLIIIAPSLLIVGAFLFLRLGFKYSLKNNLSKIKNTKIKNNNLYFSLSLLSLIGFFISYSQNLQVKYLIIYSLLLVIFIYFEDIK